VHRRVGDPAAARVAPRRVVSAHHPAVPLDRLPGGAQRQRRDRLRRRRHRSGRRGRAPRLRAPGALAADGSRSGCRGRGVGVVGAGGDDGIGGPGHRGHRGRRRGHGADERGSPQRPARAAVGAQPLATPGGLADPDYAALRVGRPDLAARPPADAGIPGQPRALPAAGARGLGHGARAAARRDGPLRRGAGHGQEHGCRGHRGRPGAGPVPHRPVAGGQQVHRRDGEAAVARLRRGRALRRGAGLRRGRRPLRQAIRRARQPRPLRQHRDELPAAAHGSLPRVGRPDHQPARQHGRRLHAPHHRQRRLPPAGRRRPPAHLAAGAGHDAVRSPAGPVPACRAPGTGGGNGNDQEIDHIWYRAFIGDSIGARSVAAQAGS